MSKTNYTHLPHSRRVRKRNKAERLKVNRQQHALKSSRGAEQEQTTRRRQANAIVLLLDFGLFHFASLVSVGSNS